MLQAVPSEHSYCSQAPTVAGDGGPLCVTCARFAEFTGTQKNPRSLLNASHRSCFSVTSFRIEHTASIRATTITIKIAQETIDSTKMIRKRYPNVLEASA